MCWKFDGTHLMALTNFIDFSQARESKGLHFVRTLRMLSSRPCSSSRVSSKSRTLKRPRLVNFAGNGIKEIRAIGVCMT